MSDLTTPLYAFPPSLLPPLLLPMGYTYRPLSSTDYSKQHLSVLSTLTQVPDPGEAAWQAQFHQLLATPETYYPIVFIDPFGFICATGTLVLERKFIRGLGKVGHVEDIAVRDSEQGKGFGKRLIESLTRLSEELGAYKVS